VRGGKGGEEEERKEELEAESCGKPRDELKWCPRD